MYRSLLSPLVLSSFPSLSFFLIPYHARRYFAVAIASANRRAAYRVGKEDTKSRIDEKFRVFPPEKLSRITLTRERCIWREAVRRDASVSQTA